MEINQVKEQDIDKFQWTGSSTHLGHFKEALEKGRDDSIIFLGAFIDGKAVGRCGIDFQKHSDGGTLWMLNVHEDFQSQGIGTKLIEAAEEEIAKRGYKYSYLSVEKENSRAISLYEKLGYLMIKSGTETWDEQTPDGKIEKYVANVFIMRKPLP